MNEHLDQDCPEFEQLKDDYACIISVLNQVGTRKIWDAVSGRLDEIHT